MALVSKLHKELGVRIGVSAVFERATIRAISGYIMALDVVNRKPKTNKAGNIVKI
jgi:hypothetical protein